MVDATQLVARLSELGCTVTTAESCTGGLLAAAITSVPGASAVFPGGVVTYANALKQQLLGVPHEVLDAAGAVSAETAAAMAAGSRRLAGADYGIAVTGIAGPTGATPTKPVGLVFVAVAGPGGSVCRRFHFAGSRDAIRRQAVDEALRLALAQCDEH